LMELTANAINIELFCYVLTRNFDEFAAVREEVLLSTMNLVEDSGVNLASTTQKFYLSPDPASPKSNDDGIESAARKPQPVVEKNLRKDA